MASEDMTASEINLRVTGQSSQGGRKYMEDAFVVSYQQTEDKTDIEYAFFGIFDGHGGKEAAQFAKNNLLDNIVSLRHFWQDDDSCVLGAIRDGFINTHLAMWKEVDNWPKTPSGLPSTAGTTASVAIIRNGKLYTGHVGDSRIIIGLKDDGSEEWQAECLTTDHKPESPTEKQRILESGGLVMSKSGVERVVWKRPRPGHKGPVLRSTDFEKIPFLAVARSLGDLWSFDYFQQEFAVSPDPDLGVMVLDLSKDKCLILASDGLWNIMTPQAAVHLVQDVEDENRKLVTKFGISEHIHLTLCNPSKVLVDCSLERWNQLQTRADNVSVITVMLDQSKSRESSVLREQLVLAMVNRGLSPAAPLEVEGNEAGNKTSYRRIVASRAALRSDSAAGGCPEGGCPLQNIVAVDFLSGHSTPCVPEAPTAESDNLKSRPFPRWSESASGRTSLSKLANWSQVVSHRRGSDPEPEDPSEWQLLPAPSRVEWDGPFPATQCACQAAPLQGPELQRNSLQAPELRSDFVEWEGEEEEGSESSASEWRTDPFRLCLDVASIRQTIKRKYPDAEVCQSFVSSCGGARWKRLARS